MLPAFRYGIVAATMAVGWLSSAGAVAAWTDGPAVTPAMLGITPEVVVVSGWSEPQAAAFLSALASAPEAGQVQSARVRAESLMSQLVTLRLQLRLDPTNVTLAEESRALRQQLATARQAFDTALETVRRAAGASLPSTSIEQLAVATQGVTRATPPEYWAVARTEAQWRQLEMALLVETRATRRGTAVPQEVSALLAAARSDPRVVEARAALETRLATMEATFSQ